MSPASESPASDVRLNTERIAADELDEIEAWTKRLHLLGFDQPEVFMRLLREIRASWNDTERLRSLLHEWRILAPGEPAPESLVLATLDAEKATGDPRNDTERLRTALTEIRDEARQGLRHEMARFDAAGACIRIQRIVEAALAESVPSPPAKAQK